jgi:hypothetical protein
MTGARTAVTTGETGERTAATASRDSAVRVRTCVAEENGLRLDEHRTLVHRLTCTPTTPSPEPRRLISRASVTGGWTLDAWVTEPADQWLAQLGAEGRLEATTINEYGGFPTSLCAYSPTSLAILPSSTACLSTA